MDKTASNASANGDPQAMTPPSGLGPDDAGAATRDAGVLITFPLSHFCEKGRWALDYAGLGYRERGYPPGVHKLAVRRHGSSSAPVLVGEQTLRQSTEILRFADRACLSGRALYPVAADERRETDDLIERFDRTLGPEARRWFYAWAVPDPRRLERWASRGLSTQQRLLLHVLAPKIASVIGGRLKLAEGSAAAAGECVDEELQMVSAKLADGRRYLGGECFGAADLTFAALAGPILCAPGYGGKRLTLPPMPDELATQMLDWRATPAGQHCLRLYREHRAVS